MNRLWMRRPVWSIGAVCLLWCLSGLSSPAHAATASEVVKPVAQDGSATADATRARLALKTCLAGAVSDEEFLTMRRWFISVMASDPEYKVIFRIDEDARVGVERETARILESLFSQRCAAPMKTALRTAGDIAWQDAVGTVFNGLRDRFLDFPQMEPSVDAMLQRLDLDRIDKVLRAE